MDNHYTNSSAKDQFASELKMHKELILPAIKNGASIVHEASYNRSIPLSGRIRCAMTFATLEQAKAFAHSAANYQKPIRGDSSYLEMHKLDIKLDAATPAVSFNIGYRAVEKQIPLAVQL